MPLDDAKAIDGDIALLGFRSRPAPHTLPAGVARYLQNMRVDQAPQPRKGTVALATDLVLTQQPAVLDFVLPTEFSVSSMTRSSGTVTVITAAPHGWSTGAFVGVEGADQAAYNGDWQIVVTGASSFTYDIGADTPASPATGTVSCASGIRIFEEAEDKICAACVYVDDDNVQKIIMASRNAAWVYRQGLPTTRVDYPAGESISATDSAEILEHIGLVYLFRGRSAGPDLTPSAITRSGQTVTVTTTQAHGLSSGYWVRMSGQEAEAYRGIYQVTVTGASSFTYDIGAATPVSPATANGVCTRVKPVLQWDRNLTHDFTFVQGGTGPSVGHIRMPAADWAVAFNRQLILPFGRDEIIMSGFGVTNDFDTLNGELRIKPGAHDWLVAVHPSARTRLLVLYRQSLHLVQRSSADLTIAAVEQVPSGVGCCARRTVCTCGDFILWLSDRGVQVLRYGQELNLLTASAPLSANVQDIFNRIAWANVSGACACYHDNRYYLAVPLDGASVNNAVLCFSFLSATDATIGEWESVDVYPGDMNVAAMTVMDYAGEQCLHYITSLGGLYVAHVGEVDQYGAPGGIVGSYDIEGIVRGRRFDFGSMEQKRVCDSKVAIKAAAGAVVDIAVTSDTSSTEVRTYTAAVAEDVTLTTHMPLRCVHASIDLTLRAGRPIIGSQMLTATVPGQDFKDKR